MTRDRPSLYLVILMLLYSDPEGCSAEQGRSDLRCKRVPLAAGWRMDGRGQRYRLGALLEVRRLSQRFCPEDVLLWEDAASGFLLAHSRCLGKIMMPLVFSSVSWDEKPSGVPWDIPTPPPPNNAKTIEEGRWPCIPPSLDLTPPGLPTTPLQPLLRPLSSLAVHGQRLGG